jgi:hypothetical protein
MVSNPSRLALLVFDTFFVPHPDTYMIDSDYAVMNEQMELPLPAGFHVPYGDAARVARFDDYLAASMVAKKELKAPTPTTAVLISHLSPLTVKYASLRQGESQAAEFAGLEARVVCYFGFFFQKWKVETVPGRRMFVGPTSPCASDWR